MADCYLWTGNLLLVFVFCVHILGYFRESSATEIRAVPRIAFDLVHSTSFNVVLLHSIYKSVDYNLQHQWTVFCHVHYALPVAPCRCFAAGMATCPERTRLAVRHDMYVPQHRLPTFMIKTCKIPIIQCHKIIFWEMLLQLPSNISRARVSLNKF